MHWWWQLLIGIGCGLAVCWVALLVALAVGSRGRDPVTLHEALRLAPDVIRLLRSLAADPDLPRGIRIRLVLLLGYLLMPIDLVPDFLPVIGYADDAIIIAIALRSVAHAAGAAALARHWPGSPAGLAALQRLAGVHPAAGPSPHDARPDGPPA